MGEGARLMRVVQIFFPTEAALHFALDRGTCQALTPGHGMATIVNITRCLAQHLLTGKRDDRLPRCFDISQERLDRAAAKCTPLL